MKNPLELAHALAHYYGTEGYFFNPLYRWMKYTDGVKFFADNAGNGFYWGLDIIGTELRQLAKVEEFLSIKLIVSDDRAVLAVDDGNDNLLYTKHIQYTDCPEGIWKFYLINDVLMLPSEY